MADAKILIFASLCIWSSICLVFSYPKGAPVSSCNGLVPSPRKHKASPMDKTSPYTLDIKVLSNKLQLTLNGEPEFKGFAMQLRRSTDNELSGEFDWDDDKAEHVKFMKCDEDSPKASITQSKNNRRDELQVDWFWPGDSIPKDGDYNITFTVVMNRKHFWVKNAPVIFTTNSQL